MATSKISNITSQIENITTQVGNLYYKYYPEITASTDAGVIEAAMRDTMTNGNLPNNCMVAMNVFRSGAWNLFALCTVRGSTISGTFTNDYDGHLYVCKLASGTFSVVKTY